MTHIVIKIDWNDSTPYKYLSNGKWIKDKLKAEKFPVDEALNIASGKSDLFIEMVITEHMFG